MRRIALQLFVVVLYFALMGGISESASRKESPILVGATVSLQGKYKGPSAMIQKAFRLWVEDVNQRGGLLGRKVKLILYDDQSNADLARDLYTKLIKQDRVDLVFSPYSTPLTLAASEVSERHEKLMLSIAAGAETPWKRNFRYLFQLYAPAKRQFIGFLDMMARQGFRTLTVLYDKTSDFNLDTVRGIKEWAAIFKIDIIFLKAFKEGERELPGLLKAARDKNAKGLILAAYPPDAYTMLGLMTKMRYRPAVMAIPLAPANPDFYRNAGVMANHVFSPSQWEPDERIHFPGTDDFVLKFFAFAGHEPTFHAASAYAACQLFEQAIKQTRSLNNRRLRDVIAAQDTATVLGRFKVDSAGKQIGHNSFIIQWQDGKKEIVWPTKMQTAPPRF
jgi:branched-chain amino acid transport system substrate-binding protein